VGRWELTVGWVGELPLPWYHRCAEVSAQSETQATSAVDERTEAQLYSLIKQRTPCYVRALLGGPRGWGGREVSPPSTLGHLVSLSSQVSVGHRPQLVAYHTHVLENAGAGSNGAWRLYTAQEYERSRARML
jgi:hypothetical protein